MHRPACYTVVTLFLLAAFTAMPALAQTPQRAVLTGTVVNAETGAPLADAHVFIAVSMNGSVTDAEGRYRLDNVPLGAHRLYVSILGYEPEARDVLLRTGGVQTFDFRLTPSVVDVGEVVVEAKEDKRWKRRLEKFTTLFIGETANAEHTKIMNPEVLDFENNGGEFIAKASNTLIIENRALGYRIQYFLKDFASTPTRVRYDGEPLYEELEPESPAQASEWAENRKKAFYGSFRHFMLAVLNDQLEREGFHTFGRTAEQSMGGTPQPGSTRFPITPSDFIKPGEAPGEYLIDFDGFVELIYTDEKEDPGYLQWRQRIAGSRPGAQNSHLLLENGPALVDAKGDLLNPYGVVFFGYLAYERVADELPKEYRPWL